MKKNERQNGQSKQNKQNKQNKKIEPRLDLQIQFFLICLLEFVVVALLAYLIGLTIEKLLGVTVNVPVFVWAIAVSIVIGGGISVWITKKFFNPVAHLKAAMREVAGGNFKVKVETDSKLEDIRSIYADFNAMVHELSAIETLQTDFISGVSHEFKTPIAAIEGYTQLLQDHTLSLYVRLEADFLLFFFPVAVLDAVVDKLVQYKDQPLLICKHLYISHRHFQLYPAAKEFIFVLHGHGPDQIRQGTIPDSVILFRIFTADIIKNLIQIALDPVNGTGHFLPCRVLFLSLIVNSQPQRGHRQLDLMDP